MDFIISRAAFGNYGQSKQELWPFYSSFGDARKNLSGELSAIKPYTEV